MPSFCRHGRFQQNCRICSPKEANAAAGTSPRPVSNKPDAAKVGGVPGRRVSDGTSSRRSSSSSSSGGGRGSSGMVVRRQARAVEDGYENELVPGLKASGDAKRLAEELAFAQARLEELRSDPPGLYAEVALNENPEEALWLAFQIAHLSPLAGEDGPFAQIESARTTWASGEPPRLGEGVVLGPRTTVDPKNPTRTADAYRVWAARAGSQEAAFRGELAWLPARRFSRVFERLALPGFARAGRVELLISLGRLGLAEIEPTELRLGDADDGSTIAAKRIFGIGDTVLLERRLADLAEAVEVPLAAFDLALFNFNQPTAARATMGSAADPDADVRSRVERALGVG